MEELALELSFHDDSFEVREASISDIRTAMATKSGSLGAQLPPADELESIIKTRFLTTAAVPKGEPPFKRLIKRFSDLVDGSAESEDSLRAFLRELSNIELTEQKMRAVIMAQKREQLGYEKKQETLFQQIEQAKADIEAKKIELVEARVVRAYMESYEGPRGEICQIPSRESTLNEQQRVLRQMAEAETEGCKYTALIERKKKAISQLFQSLSNLQKPDEEPSEQELELARALNETEIEPDAAAMELEAGEMVDE